MLRYAIGTPTLTLTLTPTPYGPELFIISLMGFIGSAAGAITNGTATREKYIKTYFNPTYDHVKEKLTQEQKQQRVAYDAQKENQATNKPALQSALKSAPKIRAI